MSDQGNIRRRKAKSLRRELVHKLVDQHLDELERDRITGVSWVCFHSNLGGVFKVDDRRERKDVLSLMIEQEKE